MSDPKKHTSNLLTLEEMQGQDAITLNWIGRSRDRNPSEFVMPVFEEMLAGASGRPIIMDFTNLEYMNSSTLTPVIKMLDKVKRTDQKLQIIYKKNLKWQDLSFSGLEVFNTADKRIEIKGV
jgi:hypothetical protein